MNRDVSKTAAPHVGAVYRVIGGDVVTCKLLGADTGGAYSVLETVSPPGAGPPPHVHGREDECFYVVEGSFEFYVEGRTIAAAPGDVLQAVRGVPHHFKNVGSTPGRLLVVVHPAGIENFFAELAEQPLDGPPDVPSLKALAERYGLTLLL